MGHAAAAAREERGRRERAAAVLLLIEILRGLSWLSAACTGRLRDQFTFPSWQYASPLWLFFDFRDSRRPIWPLWMRSVLASVFEIDRIREHVTSYDIFWYLDINIPLFLLFRIFQFAIAANQFLKNYSESISCLLQSVDFLDHSFSFIISHRLPRNLCLEALETFKNDEL